MATMESPSTKRKPYPQHQLIALEQAAGVKLDELLDFFGLQFRRAARFHVGSCPVHGGSNKSAFNIFHTGDEIVGNWRCFTHGCHEHFNPTIIGFVRGVLSRTKYGWQDKRDTDKECPFHEAVEFLIDFTKSKNLRDLKVDIEAVERHKFTRNMLTVFNREEPEVTLDVSREQIRSSLEIPSSYFISRGYTPEVLERYDVGLCTTPGKEMYMRATAPIYDAYHDRIVGCTGRSVFDQCPLCKSYHNPIEQCPSDREKWKWAKWRHNYGFKGENYLYNYWFARSHIAESGIAVIVESPGNVWRLEEAGIPMSLGTFGAHLTDGQRFILDRSGALVLIVLTDPDEAGRLAAKAIRETCGSTYTIHEPRFGEGDVSDNEAEVVRNALMPLITNIRSDLGT